MRRSIICFLIIASLILCSTSVAFANPLDPWTSVQADRVTNGVVSIDNTLSNVYTALSALYNYLKNNGDGVVEGLLVLANRVSNIISTIDYYLPNINTNLQNIYSSLAAHSGSNLDLWGLTNSILTNTNALTTGQLGIAQDVYNISGYTNSIQSKLTTLNSTEISSLAKLTNIDTNVDQVELQLTNLNTNIKSLESINWLTNNNYVLEYSSDNITYYDNLNELTPTNDLYIKFYGFYNTFQLFRLDFNNINFSDNRYFNSDEFEFTFYYNNIRINNPDYYFDYAFRHGKMLFYPFSSFDGSVPAIIKIHSVYNISYFSNSNITLKYLPFDSNDFYIVDNFIKSNQNSDSDNLEEIKNILIDIDNNSDFIQNNNDLEINVDIDAADGQGITAIILKLQDLFDFGVGLQEFLVTLNEFDNLHWFTRPETYDQVNQDPRLSPGYIDLYD